MIDARTVRALTAIHGKLASQKLNWALIGSTNLAVNGVSVVPGDIDILSDRESVYMVGSLLREWEVRPVGYKETPSMRSHLGEFSVEDVKVEVMGDIWRRTGKEWRDMSTWVLTSPGTVRLGTLVLPCCPLEKELVAYETLAREKDADKIRKIREVLEKRTQIPLNPPLAKGDT